MLKTDISLTTLQPFLESASNAVAKGQAQYFTPLAAAQRLALALPEHRAVLCDLSCGASQLLRGTSNQSTRYRLGCDIQKFSGDSTSRITADITRLYSLLHTLDWRCDLFVLNPPWDLHWHRENLAGLAESECDAVKEAFAGHDPRLASGDIDSTIASLMLALDRMTWRGEGVLIANHATLQRLLFEPGAPHEALAKHCWAMLLHEGNITSLQTKAPTAPPGELFPLTSTRKLNLGGDPPPAEPPPAEPGFKTAIVYFAAEHQSGLDADPQPFTEAAVKRLRCPASRVSGSWNACKDTFRLWQACQEEWEARHSSQPPRYHLSLSDNGLIAVNLSVFEYELVGAGKPNSLGHGDDRDMAKRLFELRGKQPLQLVLQRATRTALLETLNLWRVEPALREAVDAAVKAYHAARAPLYPLPTTQRLGYLDEEDWITCRKNYSPDGIHFHVGTRYQVSTNTVKVERLTTRRNLSGEPEDILLTGQELVIEIATGKGSVRFMSAPELKPEERARPLEELLEHFEIPEVADVAAVNPAGYAHNLARLEELEKLAA